MSNNIEKIKKFVLNLDKSFKELPLNQNTLEQVKAIKGNMLNILDTAHKIASLANEEKIYDTTDNISVIEEEMEKIKKNVLSIAVFGQMGTGKSSFLNSLVGEDILSVSQSRATSTISIIRHIDNFDGYKTNDIEIKYITEDKLLSNIIDKIMEWNNYFGDKNDNNEIIEDIKNSETISHLLNNKEKMLEKVNSASYRDILREHRKNAQAIGEYIKYVLNGIDNIKDNLGKTIKVNTLNNNELTSDELAVFLEEVVFYKNIPLLKGLEFIDTPGIGSNRQLDTQKSQKFIEKADIVLILTDAREPLQKESEQDILFILDDLKKYEQDIFEKVFIIINKIDESETSRDTILKMLNEELNVSQIEIADKNKLFISAMYEIQKRKDKSVLDSLYIRNKDNIGENDLEVLEKTIYSFSEKEATSKFIDEKISEIDSIFKNANKNFELSISQIDNRLKNITEKKSKYEEESSKIKEELEEDFEVLINDFSASYIGNMTRVLSQIRDEKIDKGEKYFEKRIKGNKYKYDLWKDISLTDTTSNKHISGVAKKEIEEIISEIKKSLDREHEKILNTKLDELVNKINQIIKEKSSRLSEDFGVYINPPSLDIDNFNIKFDEIDNSKFKIGVIKQILKILNPTKWGRDKNISYAAEIYEKHMKNTIKPQIEDTIKKIANYYYDSIENSSNKGIVKILDSIKSQLEQQQNDIELTETERKVRVMEKEYVKGAFENINGNYISKVKEQNHKTFK